MVRDDAASVPSCKTTAKRQLLGLRSRHRTRSIGAPGTSVGSGLGAPCDY
jgi:hypothetical protein